MQSFEELLSQYDYSYPEELIAQEPAHPRDSAKLLVYNKQTKKVIYDTFTHLPSYLPENALIIFNETKVVPARLYGKKETGGGIEILYLGTEGETMRAVINSKVAVGKKIYITDKLFFTVIKQEENYVLLQSSSGISSIQNILEEFGNTPIPPYIKKSPLSEKKLQEEYQTVFAKHAGSAAAPTASLHFTKELLANITHHGHEVAFITLHVGLGTFARLTEEHVKGKRLHEEWYEIPEATKEKILQAKKQGRPIIAVGTTVIRTLESAVDKILDPHIRGNISGTTDLFIQEGYPFAIISGLITNFHVPKSSLMMLISAFVGRETLLSLYRQAIERKFRLFSFGDGMLLIDK